MGDPIPDRCSVSAWKPAVHGITEAFHAHIVDWSYPAHSHDTWAILIVDRGAIDYSLDKRRCAAVEDTIAVLPPGVIHDGRPAARARDGFWKRNLYLEPGVLSDDLIGPAVDKKTITDPALRAALSAFHHTLTDTRSSVDSTPMTGTSMDGPSMDGEAQFALICEELRRHLCPTTTIRPPEGGIAFQLRRLIDEHTSQPFTLQDAANELDRSVAHLVRSFTTSFGVSPHAYLIGRRIDTARAMLLRGDPPVQVATASGFYDQAHLTRHFKRHTATTPGYYARSGDDMLGASRRTAIPSAARSKPTTPASGHVATTSLSATEIEASADAVRSVSSTRTHAAS